jgi:hypothetical protein
MASQFDESDFVDGDYQSSKRSAGASSTATGVLNRPPNREELDDKVGAAQQRLAELRRAQEELERERASLEEARRRRIEFQTGREEMLQHLTRGVALLEEAEFKARRDSEQMAGSLAGLKEALSRIQAIQEDSWTKDTWTLELTRALTTIENSRMEWNSARLKWTLLNGTPASAPEAQSNPRLPAWEELRFLQLCKIGFALSWPVALAGLLAAGALLVVLLQP